MKIVMVGMNYQTAPIEMREIVSFTGKKLEQAYEYLRNIDGIEETVIIDTCNRTEIYAYVSNRHTSNTILELLISFHNLEKNWKKNFYRYENEDAVDHLYNVAVGLDSMILGEDQILGQVKTAYQKAIEMNAVNKILNTLFRYAITSAKKIRTEVMGNNPPLSVSSIAVQFLKDKFEDLRKQKVFVIGVGKMSSITLQNLIAEGVEEIYISNRTKHRAHQLQMYFPQIKVVPYESRLEVMADCDITISSTSAPHYVVTKEMFIPHYKGKELCFVDLSLPRDIEPKLDNFGDITIFTLDDLQKVSDANMEKRKEQVSQVEEKLQEEIARFWEWYNCQEIVPTIFHLKQYYTEIADEEISSLMARLGHLDEKDRKLIYKVSKSMARRLFNMPIVQMKQYAQNGDSQIVSKVIEDLFELPKGN